MAGKVRVYELAKENNMAAKEMVKLLNEEFGLNIKSHMSMVGGSDLELIQGYFDEIEEEKNKAKNKKQQKENNKNSKNKKNHKNIKQAKDVEEDDFEEEKPKKKRKKKSKNKKTSKANKKQAEEKKDDGIIEIPETVNVKTFADKIGESPNSVIGKLIGLGVMAGLNDQIEFEQAELVALDFGKEIKLEEEYDAIEEQQVELDYEDKEEDLVNRPPVVSVMGHVDHGKTSILDKIRSTRVTSGEAGGITQHIGASVVDINDKKISFLDTPGHEAFTEMRMRGAQATDIAILVVAADDGVMPQTVEAINHAKAAGIPIVVAINKIDKEVADPNRVKQELMEHGLVSEEWGGDTIMVPVSAHTGEGIDDLLEMVLLVAEMRELKANPNRRAVGIIVEAQLDKARGAVATVLVQKGTLHAGDYVVTGSASGRIRAMFNSLGEAIEEATPSMPAQILGLSDVAEAGDMIYAVEDEKLAREFADRAAEFKREEHLKAKANTNLEDMYSDIGDGELKELNIIVKTDVKGTVDAVSHSLVKLSNEEVKVSVIAGAVGGITESDILLAQASNAVIIGFNVRPTQGALERAKDNNVEIRTYSVIYEAIEDVEKAIKGMLDPEFKEVVLGRAEVRDTFKVPGAGTVAGVMVTNGSVPRRASIRLLRDNIVIFDGDISSMKRFKDDAKELAGGYEGGIGLNRFNDIKVGDVMEAYEMVEKERD
ncbi:Translation initiation factor IF-2 [Anaerococcus prevotii]|uniref:Translation initiation factor IF-2 n=2 Tax=Anaerococcus TaxID=165779 RepID=C7RGP0_ANAPD|nr:translation initiation factor IF-2 [Anaerococcus prevotii]ACV28651.1 translation initiation factor IF-2 [Anaerococcus prevotii DSM 20548]SUU94213.1 Translation initiation factor IF-2 [Anaerococcus prevotii]